MSNPAACFHAMLHTDACGELAGQLLAPGRVAFVALVGLPGIGKTTVANAVVTSAAVDKGFQHIIRVDGVGQHPDIESIFTQVWEKHFNTGGQSCPNWLNHFDPEKAREEMSRLLRPGTLILLDDVWTGDVFKQMTFCTGDSKVLVTSRNRSILEEGRCYSADCKVFDELELDDLSANTLFRQHAFPPDGTPPTGREWKHRIEQVVNRCKRLPLALSVRTSQSLHRLL